MVRLKKISNIKKNQEIKKNVWNFYIQFIYIILFYIIYNLHHLLLKKNNNHKIVHQ